MKINSNLTGLTLTALLLVVTIACIVKNSQAISNRDAYIYGSNPTAEELAEYDSTHNAFPFVSFVTYRKALR